MRKYFILFLLILLFPFYLSAQIAVKSFRALPNDLDARTYHPVTDQNGDKCALIKVVSTETGFAWDGGSLGITKVEKKTGEYWVYIPHGAKRITIKHDQLGVLRDYIYTEAIKEAMVYEMVLTTGTVKTIVEAPKIESVWLMISSDPSEAELYIDDTYVGQTPFQKKLKKQQYNYRLSKAKYQPNAGMVDLSLVTDKKQLEIMLKPDFGSIYITSQPENGAEVFLDDNNTGKKTPCTLTELKSGTHRIKLRREWYEPLIKEITIAPEEEKTLNVTLMPSFGEITITTEPEADIYIDNQKKEHGQHTCRLSPGIYTITAQKDKHHNDEQSIEIMVGDKKNIVLNPKPQYGSLDVATNPWDADISIDGKNYGKSPTTINDLLVGTYTVKLSKAGFTPLTQSISIQEGQTASINVNLPSGKELTINSNPQGVKLYIDKQYKGITPYTTELSFGTHNLKLIQDDYEDLLQNIIVTESSRHMDFSLISKAGLPEMIFVKGGCFKMGSKGGNKVEKPVHKVCLNDFYIGKYEVTQKQWQEVMGNNPSYFKCEDCPVENVSWDDVQEFIKKLNQKTGKNYRLPTEAEWEFSARGGILSKGYQYAGSNNLDEVGWYSDNSGGKTHAVGQKKPNELGIYDMSGNIREWCNDWYDEKYYKNSPEQNPVGTSNGQYRVLRGGSCGNSGHCQSADRYRSSPDRRHPSHGFRLVF